MIDAIVAAARDVFAGELVGVYAMGSLALGAFDPARSDIDVAVVTDADPRPLVPRLDALELPVRRLALVVYRTGGGPAFAMNYNRDRGAAPTIDLDPTAVPRFVLDLAMAHKHAVVLHGPPLSAVLDRPPEDEIRRALDESLAWYRKGGDPAAAQIAEARARHYLRTGEWVGKGAASRSPEG